MNKGKFISYLDSPDKLNDESLVELSGLITQFPYFQTAHLLYAKNLHLQKSIHYNRQLKIASVYAADRKKLYELIMQAQLAKKIAETDKSAGSAVQKKKDIARLEEEILVHAISSSIAIEAGDEKTERKPQKKEKHSFNEWFRILKEENQLQGGSVEGGKTLKKSKPTAIRAEFFSPENMAKMSIVDDEDFVTETLAGIYIQQQHFEKAIRAYEILSLKYPKKKATFAARIKSVKEQIKKG